MEEASDMSTGGSISGYVETKDPGSTPPSAEINGKGVEPVAYAWRVNGKWVEKERVGTPLDAGVSIPDGETEMRIKLDAHPTFIVIGHFRGVDEEGMPKGNGDWEMIPPSRIKASPAGGYGFPVNNRTEDAAIVIQVDFPLILSEGEMKSLSGQRVNDQVVYLVRSK